MKRQNLIQPVRNMKCLFTCQSCGHVFMGRKLLLPLRCPACGSCKVKEDKRVRY
jgi:predicted Zn-ribbon and HTH transcriptional regulator